MNKNTNYLFLGLGFIIAGAALLLENYRIVRIDDSWTFAALCLLGSVAFFYQYQPQKNMGMLILSAILFFIFAAIVIDMFRFVDDAWVAILLFFLMAALFLQGYRFNNRHTGLLLPAGICLTIAAMVYLGSVLDVDGEITASLFFFGIGVSFGVMYLLRYDSSRLEWAKITAFGFIGFSLFLYYVSADNPLADLMLPLSLMVAGGYLIYRGKRRDALA